MTRQTKIILGVLGGMGCVVVVGVVAIVVTLVILTDRMMDPERLARYLKPPDLPSSPAPTGLVADYGWSVRSLDGEELSMGELEGEVVFLNFWATWCMPCVVEMPSIQALHEALATEGVRFVCVSNEDADTVRDFVGDKGYTFPIYTMDGFPPSVFDHDGIPATFILSRDGDVVFQEVGSARWDDPECIAFLREML